MVPAILLALSFDFTYFSLAAMETGLLAAMLLAMVLIVLRSSDSLWLAVLGAFAFLVHPEAVVVYPIYLVLAWRNGGDHRRLIRGRLIRGGLTMVALVAAVTALRNAYFGDVVPNTFHSKPSGPFHVIAHGYQFLVGRSANVSFPITGYLALPVLVLGYLRLRRADAPTAGMLAAVTAAGLAFGIYSSPDWTDTGRYFAPYLPAALVLFWAGLTGLIHRLVRRISQPALPIAAVLASALLLAMTGLLDRTAKMARMETFPGYVLAGKNLVGPSVWIRDHLPKDATIATRRIGALAYHGDVTIFDYTFGLADRDVARLVGASGGRLNNPADPALAALWSARQPDYLLEDDDVLDHIINQTGGTRDAFTIHGLRYGVWQSFIIGDGNRWVLAKRL